MFTSAVDPYRTFSLHRLRHAYLAPMVVSWIVGLIQLGRDEEARKKGRELLLYRPDFTIAQISRVYPFGDHILPVVTESLRKAGLPE